MEEKEKRKRKKQRKPIENLRKFGIQKEEKNQKKKIIEKQICVVLQCLGWAASARP